jgi:hypothetical protein
LLTTTPFRSSRSKSTSIQCWWSWNGHPIDERSCRYSILYYRLFCREFESRYRSLSIRLMFIRFEPVHKSDEIKGGTFSKTKTELLVLQWVEYVCWFQRSLTFSAVFVRYIGHQLWKFIKITVLVQTQLRIMQKICLSLYFIKKNLFCEFFFFFYFLSFIETRQSKHTFCNVFLYGKTYKKIQCFTSWLKLGQSKKFFGHIFKSLYRFYWKTKIMSKTS